MKALPHITHWHGFSPGGGQREMLAPPPPPPSCAPARPQAPAAGLAHPPTRVDADVPLQGAGVSELPLAVVAHVGLLPAVDPKVPLEVPCGAGQRAWREAAGWGPRGGGWGAAGPYLRW